MRRLPVYLLLDTSGSMSGEPIEAVRNGLDMLVSTLRKDPYALETAYLSVISFDSTTRQLVPLMELTDFQAPSLDATGLTSMGAALSLVADCIEREIVKTTTQTKGDWKPLVFLMTDGEPTDDWRAGLTRFRQVRVGGFIACAAGHQANTALLKQMTETVVALDVADSATISAFFKWVSGSIVQTSKKIDLSKSDDNALNNLPPPPPQVNLV